MLWILLPLFSSAGVLMGFGVVTPSSENAFWFTSTFAPVSVTMGAIILAIVAFIARAEEEEKFQVEFDEVRRLLFFSSALILIPGIGSFLSIPFIPPAAEALSFSQVLGFMLGPSIMFSVGAFLFYFAVIDAARYLSL